MPRIARIVGHGYPQHIVQRGNNRDNVFFDDDDFRAYLGLVVRYAEKSESSVIAYCLMTNHTPFIENSEREFPCKDDARNIPLLHPLF